jgi:hypothetical protein
MRILLFFAFSNPQILIQDFRVFVFLIVFGACRFAFVWKTCFCDFQISMYFCLLFCLQRLPSMHEVNAFLDLQSEWTYVPTEQNYMTCVLWIVLCMRLGCIFVYSELHEFGMQCAYPVDVLEPMFAVSQLACNCVMWVWWSGANAVWP